MKKEGALVEERTLVFIVGVLGAPVWLVAMWALVMMMIGPLKDERFTLFRLFTGYFVQEAYNRKYLRIFAACIGFLLFLALVFNVLFFSGFIQRTDVQPWPSSPR